MKMNRRIFNMTTVWGGAIGLSTPELLAGQATGTDEPIMVIIQLAGGNDGLNTIIPAGNDHYYRARPKLAIKSGSELRINDSSGMHPNLAGLNAIYDQGQLAIVEGVGYPAPNRSHFRSTEIWHTGSDSNRTEKYGWIGRYFDHYCQHQSASIGLAIGKQNPQAFSAGIPKGVTFSDPRKLKVDTPRGSEDMMIKMMGIEDDIDDQFSGNSIENLSGSSFAESGNNPLGFLKNTASEANSSSKLIEAILAKVKPENKYPATGLGRDLQVVSQLIRGDMPSRVYYLSKGGFDTHTNQTTAHGNLMTEIGDALKTFNNELNASGHGKQVAALVYSEFGRRVQENGSGGTDHGVAAPVFVMGDSIKGGFYGKRPSLKPDDLIKGDLAHTTDYRTVYATLLEKHMGINSNPVLLKKSQTLDFI